VTHYTFIQNILLKTAIVVVLCIGLKTATTIAIAIVERVITKERKIKERSKKRKLSKKDREK
jgi:hypothetical protein